MASLRFTVDMGVDTGHSAFTYPLSVDSVWVIGRPHSSEKTRTRRWRGANCAHGRWVQQVQQTRGERCTDAKAAGETACTYLAHGSEQVVQLLLRDLSHAKQPDVVVVHKLGLGGRASQTKQQRLVKSG